MYSLKVNGKCIVIKLDNTGFYKSFDALKNSIIQKEKTLVIEEIVLLSDQKKLTVPFDLNFVSHSKTLEELFCLEGITFEEALSKVKETKEVEQEVKQEVEDLTDEKIISMSFITSSTIAGMKIVETLGMARGSTVRAKHIGRDLMAELKGLVGGEIKGYTELIAEGREEAIYRMKDDAFRMGANAIVDVRFGTSTLTAGFTEMISYGTAVKIQEEE